MTRVLLTGFEPFRQWTVNSSGAAVRCLEGRPGLATAILPVDHHAAAARFAGLAARERPAVLLLTGLAAGTAFRLERLARPGPLAAAPAIRRGRWPFPQSRNALAAQGIPARFSDDAGGYVCDTTYWTALGLPGPRLCLFLHVPPLGPAWSVARIARGVEAVLDAALRHDRVGPRRPHH